MKNKFKELHFGLDYVRFNFNPKYENPLFQSFFIGLSANNLIYRN